MAVSAHDVATVLRAQMPGLPTQKLHKMLYYVQAHYLAAVGEPLFAESVAAWDRGHVVAALWESERDRISAPPRKKPFT